MLQKEELLEVLGKWVFFGILCYSILSLFPKRIFDKEIGVSKVEKQLLRVETFGWQSFSVFEGGGVM